MEIERFDGSKESQILTAMIVNKTVLSTIVTLWDKEGLFPSKWTNTIAGWCVKYYERYEKPPRRAIANIFTDWKDEHDDDKNADVIENYLSSISRLYARKKVRINEKYILDQAQQLFNRVRLSHAIEQMQGCLETGKIDKAVSLWKAGGDREVKISDTRMIDVLRDRTAIKAAFEEKQDNLIYFQSPQLLALNEFFKGQLTRDSLAALMAPEKRGKSFVLQELCWTGMEQGYKVAMFQVGDLSQGQIMRRLLTRASNRPWKPKEIKIPTYLEKDTASNIITVDMEPRSYKNWLTRKTAYKRLDQILNRIGDPKEPRFQLSCHPTKTISVKGIESILKYYDRSGWVPDIICIDYADILAPSRSGLEGRDAINETWAEMRALSQKYHCLVLTATQSDAASYRSTVLDMGHFSEDKRKMAHVTAMIGLNQTEEEKQQQLMRLNFVVLREDEFEVGQCVYVAGCRSIANPFVVSSF